jgi:acetoacetate decarboxylase
MNRYAAQPDPEETDAGPDAPDGPDGPKMWSQNLVVLYETDVDIAAMLPRPLEATDPIVRINLACVDMPMMHEPLQAGTFSVACRHGEIEGFYDLLMIMSTETAVVGGRETFGEPKKVGNVSLVHDGELGTVGASITGVMSRKGAELLEVRGTVAEVLDPGPVLLDPQGGGFDHDPTFVHVRRTQENRILERLDAEVVLHGTAFDPVDDLPVKRVVSAYFSENHQTQTGTIVGTVPGDWVWPYRHQRYDNLIARLQPAGA